MFTKNYKMTAWCKLRWRTSDTILTLSSRLSWKLCCRQQACIYNPVFWWPGSSKLAKS